MSNVNDERPFLLTAAELLRGGDSPYTRLEIPQLSTPDGAPRGVYLRPLSAGVMIDFGRNVKGDGEGAEVNHEAVLSVIAKSVCDENGNRLFSEEDVARIHELRMDIFQLLSNAIFSQYTTGVDLAKADSGATPGGSLPSN